MGSHGDWRGFADESDSPAFVSFLLAQFAGTFANEAAVDLSRAHHGAYLVSRADKERLALVKAGS